MPADARDRLYLHFAQSRSPTQYWRHLQRGYHETLRHHAGRRESHRVPARCIARGDEPAMQSDIHRYRLADGKGAAMKLHHISVAAAALVLVAAVNGAPAQQQINSNQMATSLAG